MKTIDFIQKAQKKHKNKYNYSKSKYIDSRYKVEIICPIHGSFFQLPNDHLVGHGCRLCGIERRTIINTSSKNEFIKKVQKTHKKKYDYSKIVYINSRTKIEIICSIHGSFFQKPVVHLRGSGCPKCGIEKNRLATLSNKDKFIQRAQKIHGTMYNYSKIKYLGNKIKIEIVCFLHGSFFQTPINHLNGQGCPKCGIEKIKKALRGNTLKFIEKAQKLYNNRYDYSEVAYVKSLQKVKIGCPIHGVFYVTPGHHLSGSGCAKCKSEKLRNLFKSNTKEFIKKAQKIHGNRYDYSCSVYISNHKKLKIRCPTHGFFFQTPNNHLSGLDCKLCGLLKLWNTTKKYHWKTGKELICRGSYEDKTVEYFNKNKIDFLWQSKKFKIPKSLSIGRTYLPDAFLIEKNKWIEIKGYFWGNSKKKWDWFHSEHITDSELWDEKKLKEIGVL